MARTPNADELAKWETLCWAALSHAQQVAAVAEGKTRLPAADQLIKARKACRMITLPAGQQTFDAPIMRLLRLVDRWAAIGPDERRAGAAELRDLAGEAAKLAGFME